MPKNSKGKDVAEVISSKCSGCQICIAECAFDAIIMEDGVALIDPEKCTGCTLCVSSCPSDAIIFSRPVRKRSSRASAEANGTWRGIAVFLEYKSGKVADVSWELTGKAREMADKMGTEVIGFILGGDDAACSDAIAMGCDSVYRMQSAHFESYTAGYFGEALAELTRQIKPEILLIGATHRGSEISGLCATKLETGLTADCTELDITDDRLLVMTRPTFGGNIMATILCREKRPQMSTVRPGVMKKRDRDGSRKGTVKTIYYSVVPPEYPRILQTIPSVSETADISSFKSLIVLGKGVNSSLHYGMLEELAHLLGGTLACSRPLVEAGLFPYERQVGQTGRTVSPRLYVGIGVSGAVQHMAGIQGSEKIIAINSDRNSPMVSMADYSIIGDYAEIVPLLIERIKARGAEAVLKGER